jgi:DNA-binding MurR/RpiR family transcriptional regulator
MPHVSAAFAAKSAGSWTTRFVRFAESVAAGGFATFHLSLEDPLLASHATHLDKLGMSDDEPISHAMVSRSIERLQQ